MLLLDNYNGPFLSHQNSKPGIVCSHLREVHPIATLVK